MTGAIVNEKLAARRGKQRVNDLFMARKTPRILIRGPLPVYPHGRLVGMSVALVKGGLDEITVDLVARPAIRTGRNAYARKGQLSSTVVTPSVVSAASYRWLVRV